MSKLKGIVIKTEGRYMWVATEDRSFKRFPLPAENVKPGQEVWVPLSGKTNSNNLFRTAVAACLILIMLSGLALGVIIPANTAAAYVALDINPSLELGLNNHNKVIETVPLNEDAKVLLKDLNLKSMDAYQAIELLIKKAEAEGYISPERENVILMTVIPTGEDYRDFDTIRAKELVLAQLDAIGAFGSVGIQSSSMEEKEMAQKEGLSVNSYLMLKKASAKGLVKQALRGKKENSREILKEFADEGVELEQLLDEIAVTPPGRSKQKQPPGQAKKDEVEKNNKPAEKVNPGKEKPQQKPPQKTDADSPASSAGKKQPQVEQDKNKDNKAELKGKNNGAAKKSPASIIKEISNKLKQKKQENFPRNRGGTKKQGNQNKQKK